MKEINSFFSLLNKLDENKNFHEADRLEKQALNFRLKNKNPRDPFKEIMDKLNFIQNQVADLPTDGMVQDEIDQPEKTQNDTNQAE